jgi:hypothetical protein
MLKLANASNFLVNRPPIIDEGLVNLFNGVDISQTRGYIKLSCSTYVRHLFSAHYWSIPRAMESKVGSHPFEPFPESDPIAMHYIPPPVF